MGGSASKSTKVSALRIEAVIAAAGSACKAGAVTAVPLFKVTALPPADSAFKAAAVMSGSPNEGPPRLVAAVALTSAAAFRTSLAIVAPHMKGFAAIASADSTPFSDLWGGALSN